MAFNDLDAYGPRMFVDECDQGVFIDDVSQLT